MSKQVRFVGRVHPALEGEAVICQGTTDFDGGTSFTTTITIDADAVICDVTLTGEMDFELFSNCVKLEIERTLDAVGLVDGRAYSVEVVAAEHDGHKKQLGTDAYGPTPLAITEADVLKLARDNRPFDRATRDIRAAIREPTDTGFHSYRSIESLRYEFGGDSNKGAAWQNLRAALRVSEASIMQVKELADKERHGQMQDVSAAERDGAITLAREVATRFVVFKANGALDAADFPEL